MNLVGYCAALSAISRLKNHIVKNTSLNTKNFPNSNIQLATLSFASTVSCPVVACIKTYFVKSFVWAVRTMSCTGRKTTNRLCQSYSSWTPGLGNRQQSRTLDRLAALLKNGDKLGMSLTAFSSYVMTPPDSCGFSNQCLCSADSSIGGADHNVGDNCRGTLPSSGLEKVPDPQTYWCGWHTVFKQLQ